MRLSCFPLPLSKLTRAVHANLNVLVSTFQLTASGGKAFESGCAVFERLITLYLVRARRTRGRSLRGHECVRQCVYASAHTFPPSCFRRHCVMHWPLPPHSPLPPHPPDAQQGVAESLAAVPAGDERLVRFSKQWAAHRLITECV